MIDMPHDHHSLATLSLDTVACIRGGLNEAKKGLGRSAEELFDEMEREAAEPRNLKDR